jgi:kynurenine formamidase
MKMCDAPHETGFGWRGWMDLPASEVLKPTGPWIDLSHPLSSDMPRVSFFPVPRFEQIMEMPEHPLNVTEMQMVVHLGTHVDSPRHFFRDGPAFEDIPIERLHGRGVTWRIDKAANSLIEPEDLEACTPKLEPGDILMLTTGWSDFVGSPKYDDEHPSLSLAAAEWIVAQKVKLLAVDFPTPDLPVAQRPEGFNWPVHHALLGDGVLVSEHLRNVDTLVGSRAEFVFCALNITKADGAPARVLGRRIAA